MAKTVFQRYTTDTGEKYQFELTDDGIIYLYDRSTKSRTQLNEGDRAAIERGLITIGDWDSDPAGYNRAVQFYLRELKKAKEVMSRGARKKTKKKK